LKQCAYFHVHVHDNKSKLHWEMLFDVFFHLSYIISWIKLCRTITS